MPARATPSTTHLGISFVLCIALLLAPVAAGAASNEAQARALSKVGQKAYDLGQFDVALKSFSEAFRMKDLPGFLFNIAQCHRQLGDFDQAVFFYRRYLDRAPNGSLAQNARDLLK